MLSRKSSQLYDHHVIIVHVHFACVTKIDVFAKTPGLNLGSLDGSEPDMKNDQKRGLRQGSGERRAETTFPSQNRLGEGGNGITAPEQAWGGRE